MNKNELVLYSRKYGESKNPEKLDLTNEDSIEDLINFVRRF